MSEPTVTAVLVAYNSEAVIGEALRPLAADPNVSAVIVVDNCSTDDTCELIRKDFPQVKLIENPKNDGFGRANNIALKKTQTPYALAINPDAVVEKETISLLLAAAIRYPDAAILAPRLYDAGGEEHRSYKRSIFARDHSKDEYTDPEGDLCAEFLSGACWLLNMKLMQKVGFFDPAIFLYYEDDDLCLRARQAGHGLVLVHEARAMHLMGKSSGAPKPGAEYFRQKHMSWSRLYIEEKHRGKKAAQSLARKQRFSYAIKAAIYTLLFDKQKLERYRGRLDGIFAFTEAPPAQSRQAPQ